MNIDTKNLVISIGAILSICVVIIFTVSVKNKIKSKEKFDGITWGIVNGIVGPGILWVLLGHASINNAIDKIKDKKYKKYALGQMREFVKNYGLFLVLRLIITIFVLQ